MNLTDNSGNVQDTIAYDAFGNVTTESNPSFGDRFKYTGRELDSETGFQYNRARYYDAAIGRWTSQDPLGFAAGDANLYRYVGNSPTNATDPSGLIKAIEPQGSGGSEPGGQPNPPAQSGGGSGTTNPPAGGGHPVPGNTPGKPPQKTQPPPTEDELEEWRRLHDPPIQDSNLDLLWLIPFAPKWRWPGPLTLGGAGAAGAGREMIERNGFRFSRYYYNRLWETGRKAPSLIAREVLEGAGFRGTPVAGKPGFYRYVFGGWEMIFNPTTREVWHLVPTK